MAPGGTGLEDREAPFRHGTRGARRRRPRLRAKPRSPPAEEGRALRGKAPRGSRSTGTSDGGLHPIRSGTQGRSEGRRLGYLCLQQQHVEVGDRLSVDAQELQFTSQSICQLSNLKLPGERAESRAALWEQHRAAVALRLLGNTAQDHPQPLSLEGPRRATQALRACHPLCEVPLHPAPQGQGSVGGWVTAPPRTAFDCAEGHHGLR